jgi:hypothetical protein
MYLLMEILVYVRMLSVRRFVQRRMLGSSLDVEFRIMMKAVVAHFGVLCLQLPGGIWEDQERRQDGGSYGQDANPSSSNASLKR